MVSHHPAKFGGYRHGSDSGNMFLVVGGQDSTRSRFSSSLLFILKHMACHALTHKISGPSHNN